MSKTKKNQSEQDTVDLVQEGQLELFEEGINEDKHEDKHEIQAVEKGIATTTKSKKKKEIYHTGYDGTEYTDEEWNAPALVNGPTRKEVEGWKERYNGYVYFTPFEGQVFVWRTLKRPEYREIMGQTSNTAMDREEKFTELCVLYPYNFNIEKINKDRAGIASLLSEMIMEKSGFVAQSAPIKL